jgi:hypothetical protein
MASEPQPPREDYIDTDDLFSKLDQLINRHQGRAAARPATGGVPTLTEAVDAPSNGAPEIPVLRDVVEIASAAAAGDGGVASLSEASLRQLQIALYLRLRQRLDQELTGDAFAFVPPQQMSRIAQALRGALSEVVRDSVEQLFARGPGQPR